MRVVEKRLKKDRCRLDCCYLMIGENGSGSFHASTTSWGPKYSTEYGETSNSTGLHHTLLLIHTYYHLKYPVQCLQLHSRPCLSIFDQKETGADSRLIQLDLAKVVNSPDHNHMDHTQITI